MNREDDGWDAGPNRWNSTMTLGEAMSILQSEGWACACSGPPWPSPPGTPCWCALALGQVHALHRAAHIIVKLIADSTGREG